MATQLFLTDNPASTHRGANTAKLNGSTSGWQASLLSASRGDGVVNLVTSTVAGTTLGVEVESAGIPLEWISEPLAADVTISGSITFNLRAAENNMSANVGMQVVIDRLNNSGILVETVINSERGVELGTTEAAQNWSATPASTAFFKGDRIRIRVAGNDVGTMAAAFTFTLYFDGTSAGASGDSYVTFTETFSFMTATPAGSTLYLTDVAGPVVGAAVEKEMWTSRGDGVNSITVNTAAGWANPIQWTDSAGGTVVEWYSRPLTAFTLAERVLVNIRALESNVAANGCLNVELAVCEGDGSGDNALARAHFNDAAFGELGTTESAAVWYLAVDDLSINDGQRLRVRVRLDDISTSPLVTGHTATLFYDGTSGGASGDSFITLTQTVSEFVAVTRVPKPTIVNFAATRASTF